MGFYRRKWLDDLAQTVTLHRHAYQGQLKQTLPSSRNGVPNSLQKRTRVWCEGGSLDPAHEAMVDIPKGAISPPGAWTVDRCIQRIGGELLGPSARWVNP